MRAALVLLALVLAAPAAEGLDVPPLTGRVVDLGHVLDAATEAALTERLAAHEDSTSNQIVVLTIPSLDGEILEQYATRVFRTWGLGQAATNNGVLLLVAVADRELRIEVGYGLEGNLTDATAGTIIRLEIVPRFRDGDFNGGVLAGTDAILLAVKGAYDAPVKGDEEGLAVGLLFSLFLLFGAVVPVLRGGGPGRSDDVKAGVVGALLAGPIAFLLWRLTGLWVVALVLPFVLALCLVALNRWIEGHPTLGPKRRHFRKKQEAFSRARKRGATMVVVDGHSYSVPTASSGDGGGFSGGGGSSGGGGASGSW